MLQNFNDAQTLQLAYFAFFGIIMFIGFIFTAKRDRSKKEVERHEKDAREIKAELKSAYQQLSREKQTEAKRLEAQHQNLRRRLESLEKYDRQLTRDVRSMKVKIKEHSLNKNKEQTENETTPQS